MSANGSNMLKSKRTGSTRTRGLARTATITGILTGAIVTAFLVPGTAQAAPSTQDQLDSVKAEYDKAVEERDRIFDQIETLEDQIEGSGQTIDGAVALTRTTPAAINRSGSLLSQLTQLSDLAREQARAVDTASAAIAAANAAKTALEGDLEAAKGKVDDLAGQRDELENKLAEESAKTSSSSYSGDVPNVSGRAGQAVSFAYGAIGIPYVFGATGPNSYDCSGLTMAAWKAAGVSLPHYTVDQWNATKSISRSELAPGDLVFYAGLQHVGIYVGDGKVIHAPQPGESVKISDVDMMTPDGYRRV